MTPHNYFDTPETVPNWTKNNGQRIKYDVFLNIS